MPRKARVDVLPMSAPDDVSGIETAIAAGGIDPRGIVAILAKTEGNGCVNDFSRGYAVQALRMMLSHHLDPGLVDAIPMVMSGGTEGGLSPHWIVFHEDDGPDDAGHALAFASAITRPLLPSEIGRPAQAELVRVAVAEAMEKAGIARSDDMHYVQVKCPLLTVARVAEADEEVATTSMLASMGLSRGASALGVALALGEIDALTDGAIGRDLSLWSTRASCSAGIELTTCEVVVIGESANWSGPLRITHGVMRDAIDAAGVMDVLAHAGIKTPETAHHVQAILAKTEASTSGQIRGNRHTMLEDNDISATRHARGFVGGLLAGLVGRTDIFVSGGAEHQGPDGGGPLAIIYNTEE